MSYRYPGSPRDPLGNPQHLMSYFFDLAAKVQNMQVVNEGGIIKHFTHSFMQVILMPFRSNSSSSDSPWPF
jgi:hypothetical protein